jgi:iron(III) transport system ATP-binding protein
MAAKAIRFERVSKQFGEGFAVNDVSFVVQAGTLVTLLGPSGCGKTTTLRMIAGLEVPTAGRIFIGDKEVTNLSASERDVSMVFQSYALFPHMSVLENVGYGLKVQGLSKTAIAEQAMAALATVGLSGLEARYPSQLSGGQQQRVAVARALVLKPSVLLFDEPLSNLDAKLRRKMREEIRELQHRLQLTVVYVTHDQSEAMAVSDRIVVMNKSIIVQEGTPDELYQTPATSFVAGFMGDANQVAGRFIAKDEEHGMLEIGSVRMSVPHPSSGSSSGSESGAIAVDVSIRPEAIRVTDDKNDDTITTSLAATVKKVTYIGAWMEYTLDSAIGELFMVDPMVQRRFTIGQSLRVAFASHGVIVMKKT